MLTKLTKNKIRSIFKINYIIFPFLLTLTFFISLLESFTYSGYSLHHLFLPFQLLLVLSVFSGILTRFTPLAGRYETEIQSPYKVLFTINKLIILPLLASYLLIMSLELQNYPNYVFSTLHLQPNLYFWTSFLSVFLFLINLRLSNKDLLVRRIFIPGNHDLNLETSKKNILLDILLRIAIFVFTLSILANNIFTLLPWILEKSNFMIRHPLATYDEKMRYGLGDFYDYMLFIKTNTPENAIIMYPPMIYPWADVGNGGLIRYFLYPREIVQNMTDVNTEIDPQADYVMLAWGFENCGDGTDKCKGWPRKEITAEKIIYKKSKSTEVEKVTYNVTYNYEDEVNKGAWGLIKIRKD